ncbi:MAG: dNTP triphosphohydrolase [Actinomyces ruminicola]|nr:dNTP triphosphohydrolase [Actinomyces ruminicola]
MTLSRAASPSVNGVRREHNRVAILPSSEEMIKRKYSRFASREQLDSKPEFEQVEDNSQEDSRRLSRRDHDKIYYCRAWRRLSGVTQVISPGDEEAPIHNRMTHSEKVALTAWAIASNLIANSDAETQYRIAQLGGLDADMAAAAALAHDLGHPPFGHTGEQALNAWAERHGLSDGFEGNAQTFRIVTRLARWSKGEMGLNLHLGTLTAIAKYPWIRGAKLHGFQNLDHNLSIDDAIAKKVEDKKVSELERHRYWEKFSSYNDDESALLAARSWMPDAFKAEGAHKLAQSLEASVMDCADDISYAIHDFEDFAGSRLIDLKPVINACQDWLHKEGEKDSTSNWCTVVAKRLDSKDPEQFKPKMFKKAVEWFVGQLNQENIKQSTKPEYQSNAEILEALRTSDWLDDSLTHDSFYIVEDEPAGTQWNSGPMLRMKPEIWHRIALLKSMTLDHVVASPVVSAHQMAARRTVRDLADALFQWADARADEAYRGVPDDLRNLLVFRVEKEREKMNSKSSSYYTDVEIDPHKLEQITARCVIDYICSLTDRNVRRLASRLNGQEAGPLMPMML